MPRPPFAKIIVICGPTGVGKTGFAIESALKFGGEIIGADSMQVYRRLDIGTAKPTPAERARIAHHLVDCIEPDRDFSAADYAVRADGVLLGLFERGVLPFVVGGTGLYIKALVYGLFEAPPPDEQVRQRLRRQAGSAGAPALHRRLAELDPTAAGRIHPNDALRITRALEVVETTGQPISTLQEDHGFRRPRFDVLKLGLMLPRDRLYARIDQRVDMMLADGLETEVRHLLARGYHPGLKSMQSLGYRHLTAFLEAKLAWDEAVATLKRDHRRYAKRQMTWFQADPDINWLQPDQSSTAAELIERFLTA